MYTKLLNLINSSERYDRLISVDIRLEESSSI